MEATCETCKLLSISIQLRWVGSNWYDLTHLGCGCESRIQFASDDIRCLFEEGWVDNLILNLTINHPDQSKIKGMGDFASIWGMIT